MAGTVYTDVARIAAGERCRGVREQRLSDLEV
jgi:hypothetical protein